MNSPDIVTEAFTELAPHYEKVVDKELQRFWGWSYNDFVTRLIQDLDTRDGDVVLDIATGTSVIPLKLAETGKLKGKVIGLDITPAMLLRGKQRIAAQDLQSEISLVCASAMNMPYVEESFDAVLCGLAIHHLDLGVMLSESNCLLKDGGQLVIGDVGGSPLWKLPGVSLLLKIFAFFYFLIAETMKRAWAEATAVSHIFTEQEWTEHLNKHGFVEIQITKLVSKHFWAPNPLIITAMKKNKER